MAVHPRSSYEIASGLFLRLLGAIYLIAIVSLWTQIDGLVGSHGILPAGSFLDAVAGQLGPERYWRVPTLSWLDPSDAFLHAQCAAGALLAVLVIAGRFQAPALAGLWVIYLSLVTVGRDFLGFQWDNLLLESGLLAIFLAPPRLATPVALPRPSPVALWLLRWLLFRLILSSGIVKLTSGDPAWRDLTALLYHYETQPLPHWISWYAHQLPAAFQRFSAAAMFFIELVVPFFIWWPRRARLAACALLVALQLLILWTGNYGFFNLLTIALAVLLIDDAAWPRLLRRGAAGNAAPRRGEKVWRWAAVTPALVVAALSPILLVNALRVRVDWPRPLVAVYRAVSPLRSCNGYGLFAVMTTERPEIIVEGSNDGAEWRPYRFRWKPGDVGRAPRVIAGHMPRLDWQMWFAALGTYRQNPWFIGFLARLAEGSPPVLGLLADNPFPAEPPRFFRARLYDYRFTDFAQRAETGAWWRREPRGDYLPVVGREQLLAVLRRSLTGS